MKTYECLGVKISSPNKIIYADENITKLDVIKYYLKVSPLMLPFLKYRPLSAIRCPEGASGECFFKKHPSTESGFSSTFVYKNEEHFCIKNEKDIISQAQMGTLEFHPWGCKINAIDKPDIMIFDLDPDKTVSLPMLRQGVLHLKEILDNLNLKSFLKTSGGKGYHVVVPFSHSSNWEKFATFAKNVAILMEKQHPKLYTTNIRKKDRKGKIFIDYLRNDRGSTCVSPYSLRARPNAPVSMPIPWRSLNKIAPNEITIKKALKLINNKNPWENFFNTSQKIL